MANAKQLSTALLTEHLRYTPLTLLDDIINTVNELVARAVDAAEEGLLAADPHALGYDKKYAAENRIADTDADGKPIYPEMRGEIEEGCHQLETLLESNVDRNFDKLEIFVLRNVLSVPEDVVPWVRLAHYDGLKMEGGSSVEDVRRLRRKVRETTKLRDALGAQVRKNEELLAQLRALIAPDAVKSEQTSSPSAPGSGVKDTAGSFAFLTQAPAAQLLGVMPIQSNSSTNGVKADALSTNTSFALSQLPALKAVLAELRPKLPSLADASVPAPENEVAWERRLYLETQSRKVLERRGIAMGESGTEPLGRRIGSDELAALEGIVEGLDRGRTD